MKGGGDFFQGVGLGIKMVIVHTSLEFFETSWKSLRTKNWKLFKSSTRYFNFLIQDYLKSLKKVFFLTDHFSRCNLLSVEVLPLLISFLFTNKVIFTAPNIYNCLFSLQAHKSKFDYVPFPDMTEKKWKRVCKKYVEVKSTPFFTLLLQNIKTQHTFFHDCYHIYILVYIGKKKWKTHIFAWYEIVMELERE